MQQSVPWRSRFFSGLLAFASFFLAVPCSPANAANCVLIIEGSDPNIDIDNWLENASERSAAQYAARGYTVIRARTRSAILMALNNPCVNRLVYTGHGVYDAADNPVAQWWIGPGVAESDYLSASDIIMAIPAPRRSGILAVQMNACGQLLPEWGMVFPSARIWGWNTEVTLWSVKWDQFFNQRHRIPHKAPRSEETGGPGLFPTPYDSRIAEGIELTPNGSPGVRIARNWTDVTSFGFEMAEPIRSAFGSKRFNVIVGDSEEDQVVIGGFEAAGGVMIAQSEFVHPMPDFVVHFTHAGFGAAIVNRDILPAVFGAGEAMIGANMTPVPGPVLFQGVCTVLFGLPTSPPPGCPGDADGSGVVDFGDITSVLANFGQSGPPFRPGDADGNGVVDFGDITAVLANWGNECP